MNSKKQSAVLTKGSIIGTLELIEELQQKQGKVRCVKCGAISIKSVNTLYGVFKNPTQFCRDCYVYKSQDKLGCMTLIEQIEKDKQTTKTAQGKVKCNVCGKEYIIVATTISAGKKDPPQNCKFCRLNKRNIPKKFKKGDIVGNCYELISYKKRCRGDVKCIKCGKIQEQEIHNLLKHKKDTCYYCEHPNGHVNENTKHRNHFMSFKDRYYNYYSSRIISDNNRGKKFKEGNLSKDDFGNLVNGNCYYCGNPPNEFNSGNKNNKRRSLNEIILLNGIDRIDSNKGYSVENCVSCCTTCNTIKSTIPQKMFLDCVDRIYLHQHSETIEKRNGELSRVESSDSKQKDSEKNMI